MGNGSRPRPRVSVTFSTGNHFTPWYVVGITHSASTVPNVKKTDYTGAKNWPMVAAAWFAAALVFPSSTPILLSSSLDVRTRSGTAIRNSLTNISSPRLHSKPPLYKTVPCRHSRYPDLRTVEDAIRRAIDAAPCSASAKMRHEEYCGELRRLETQTYNELCRFYDHWGEVEQTLRDIYRYISTEDELRIFLALERLRS